MLKLSSRGFRKCGTFWACELFNGSYCWSKSDHVGKSRSVTEIRRCQKKRHGHNFDFSGLKRIGWVTNRVDHTCYSFQARKTRQPLCSITPPKHDLGRVQNISNPSTPVDLKTKVHKCNSQHFDDKVLNSIYFEIKIHFAEIVNYQLPPAFKSVTTDYVFPKTPDRKLN